MNDRRAARYPVDTLAPILGGAAILALLAPLAILVVALPVVRAVRGILEVIGWLFGVDLQ